MRVGVGGGGVTNCHPFEELWKKGEGKMALPESDDKKNKNK